MSDYGRIWQGHRDTATRLAQTYELLAELARSRKYDASKDESVRDLELEVAFLKQRLRDLEEAMENA